MPEAIVTPHCNDILLGRGNDVNKHAGNKLFRRLVKDTRIEYLKAPKREKPKYARIIVDTIKNLDPPGRFLKRVDKMWFEVEEKKAIDKTRQALREDAPQLKKKIGMIKEHDNGTPLSPKTSIAVPQIPPMTLNGDDSPDIVKSTQRRAQSMPIDNPETPTSCHLGQSAPASMMPRDIIFEDTVPAPILGHDEQQCPNPPPLISNSSIGSEVREFLIDALNLPAGEVNRRNSLKLRDVMTNDYYNTQRQSNQSMSLSLGDLEDEVDVSSLLRDSVFALDGHRQISQRSQRSAESMSLSLDDEMTDLSSFFTDSMFLTDEHRQKNLEQPKEKNDHIQMGRKISH